MKTSLVSHAYVGMLTSLATWALVVACGNQSSPDSPQSGWSCTAWATENRFGPAMTTP
jgi:hypothetical protein